MPKTLAALPSSQYAIILSLTFGKLDFAAVAPFSTALATVDADLKLGVKNCFDAMFRIGELALQANDGAVNRLKTDEVA